MGGTTGNPENNEIRLKAGPDDDGRRLDRILRKALPGCALSLAHRLLRQRKVLVDGKPAAADARVGAGQEIVARLDRAFAGTPALAPAENPAELPREIARGAGIVFFDKPAGMPSHGPGSLDEIFKASHAASGARKSLSFVPGPLNRLDRPTSGLIAFSLTLDGARLFTRLLRERRVEKTYLAIVDGIPGSGALEWKDALDRDHDERRTFVARPGDSAGSAKDALTIVRVLAASKRRALIEARIATGRTHQIRAQAAARGHPLSGDAKYGGRAPEGGDFFLHAWKLGFSEEIPGLPALIAAPPPPRFARAIRAEFGPGAESVLAEMNCPTCA
ncbi:MAG: RluA family pseudouridine synthase [Treponema sp.]|nr:RluA family pseudouridine synthase [Treponema sp.]